MPRGTTPRPTPKVCTQCLRPAVPGEARCEKHKRKTPVANAYYRRLRAIGHGTCAKCMGVFTAKELRVDHIAPLSQGGRDVVTNLQSLCKACHDEKTKNERRGIWGF